MNNCYKIIQLVDINQYADLFTVEQITEMMSTSVMVNGVPLVTIDDVWRGARA